MKGMKINPWWWVPTLYFAEGIPYFIVNNISVIMFTNMGMSKGDMAMYTSLLYLPWVIKPLWTSVGVAHRLSSCGSWALEHGLSSCGAGA